MEISPSNVVNSIFSLYNYLLITGKGGFRSGGQWHRYGWNCEPSYGGIKGVAICTLKFGGKKNPWVDLKIKGGNCELPLKVDVDILFYLQCGHFLFMPPTPAPFDLNFAGSKKVFRSLQNQKN